jgi:hypothetical protein
MLDVDWIKLAQDKASVVNIGVEYSGSVLVQQWSYFLMITFLITGNE